MGMLMRRHYVNNMAAGATEEKVAPKPTQEVEEVKEAPEITEEKPDKKLTRSEIMKMNLATVRAYAEEQGIQGANAKSGAELKRILGDMLFEESE